MSEPRFDIPRHILNGDSADIYFRRTDEILKAKGLNPVVAMEIFPRDEGILCGVKEICQLLREAKFEGELWSLERATPSPPRKPPCASSAATRASACTKPPS